MTANPEVVHPSRAVFVGWRPAVKALADADQLDRSDWIGLFRRSDDELLERKLVTCAESSNELTEGGSCEFELPGVAGDYDFRLVRERTGEVLASSAAVSVVGDPER
jgi:hypothetical protein